MAVFSSKKTETLEAEVARLNDWIEKHQAADAFQLEQEVASLGLMVATLKREAEMAQAATSKAVSEEQAARTQLADDLDLATMHEAGLYTFNHRLDSAPAYKTALVETQKRMKEMIRQARAIETAQSWTVNNSEAQGRKMIKDISTLMLRAYNAEADTIVRTLRPTSLPSAKARLDKAAIAIERLGKMMSIRIAPDYHRLRFYELELTADFLIKKEQEKEAERERRAELREQQRAAAEMKAALEKLSKEQAHYQNLLAKLDKEVDPKGWETATAKLAELDSAIAGVEKRAANIRTGHVYVISNVGAFGPDMVKIGMTRRLDPQDRVNELGDASVPFRFDVHAMIFHEDAVTLETQLHDAFAARKVNKMNPRREFFFATPAEVKDVLANVAGAMLVEYQDTPTALEWRASGSTARNTQPPADAKDDALEALDDATSESFESDSDEFAHVLSSEDDSNEELSIVDGEDSTAGEIADETSDMVAASPSALLQSQAQLPAESSMATNSTAPLAQPVALTAGTAPRDGADSIEVPAVAPPVQLPPAAWYGDPKGLKRLRYWDGAAWTAHTSD